MEETLNETLPPLTSETEPPPIPPQLSPPPLQPHETKTPPSPPHITEPHLSPSHQTVTSPPPSQQTESPPSPPPNPNLALIPFVQINPKPMTTVFPSKAPSSSDPKPMPTVFSSKVPSPSLSKSKSSKAKKSKPKTSSSSIPTRKSQRMRSVNKTPIIDTTVHVIDSDEERTEPRVIETGQPQPQPVESQPQKSPSKRKATETSVETTPPPSKQPKKSVSKKRKQAVESSPPQPQKKLKASSSSSPRAQAKGKSEASKKVRAASLDDVFGDPAIKAAYLSKWADKAIANGRQVNLVDMATRGQDIKSHFDALGWTPILSVKELQYTRLTRAFYAVAKFRTNCEVSVTLKGVSFKLTPEVICNLFHIENKGVHLYGDKWFDHYKLESNDVFESFLEEGFDERPTAANLNPMCHLFHNITVQTILTRAGSWDKVNNSDLNVVYHLVHKKPLNLGYLILAHMKHSASLHRFAPYAMLLTKIFREFKVPLDDEIGSDECAVIDGSILGRLRIATVPKPKKKKTATHKISGSIKKKGKASKPLAEAEAEEELPELEAYLSESGSETLEPSEEIEYSTPEPKPESPKEGSETDEAETGESEDDSESEEEPENKNKDEAKKEDVQQDHALAKDNFTSDHNTPPIPSSRKSPSPIPFEHQSSPLPNLNEDVQEVLTLCSLTMLL